MDLAPIILFAYNRPEHLQKTVFSLAQNELATDSVLHIYCDGSKNSGDFDSVQKTRLIAKTTEGFKNVIVYERSTNMGLAANIIAGVTEIVTKYDRVIVLEDDMLTSPYFLRYMNDGLILYKDNPDVASVHAWFPPHNIKSLPDTFFLMGADCWGWGTWQRAWSVFNPDASVLLSEIEERNLALQFNMAGAYDYTGLLRLTATGQVDSWAIRWLASAYLANMYTLYPSRSLVMNFGMDGTGRHCGITDKYNFLPATEPVVVRPYAEIDENELGRQALGNFLVSCVAPSPRKTRIEKMLLRLSLSWWKERIQKKIGKVRKFFSK